MELTTVWFVLIGILWAGYFVLEGFDFGVGMLFPVLGRGADRERRRRVLLNTIGPTWDGNEVWLVTAAGATFAAFPEWYATLFSGFYLILLVILVALILRVLAFDYRGKRDDPSWRKRWDAAIVFGSVVPAFAWGLVFTNMIHGLPINSQGVYTGGLLTLLNPLALLGGLTTLALFLLHGSIFVALKTDGTIRREARHVATRVGVVAAVLAIALLVVLNLQTGNDISWICFVAAVIALVVGLVFNVRGREGWAFSGTFVAIGLTVAALFTMLFPDVMPSTSNAAWSLTTDNASSSHLTLAIMSWVALLFTPIVVLYQGWAYWIFRRRISTDQIPPATEPRLASEQVVH
ncbi:cytochrome d ubiquinol oxidase subunit II [Leekyejoonella antrihumi]|uniref:Cytochrome d ubiquinol oxidase subunit II n=1 Tax=Leekyejoonella antrihumi TaxID=1660198 RepID=A0A563E6J2_9MICO|nr:cytochrome d ubiquinol oxidase subunit II [Leekyejoonella antrihumi]TWP37919.1 cytochrome d ubiquinol oxidase subunit II [Leekyejoonella antrihumi]